MTVREVIEKVGTLRRNNRFTIGDKMRWLNQCEAKIQLDCLLMPCVEVQYDYTADANEELVAKTPHDELYVYYVCAKIDEALGEMAMYNDTIAMYNDVHGDFQKWLIKTYDPKHNVIHLKRDHPVIYRGDEVTITVYGLPAEAGEVTEAKALLAQGETTTEKDAVTLEGDTMSFTLTARESYALSKGLLEIGYDITADGYRYKDEAACKFYVKLAPELQAIADGVTGSPVDASLTIHGRAADAGVTGEKIQEVLSLVSQVQEAAAALGVDLQKMAVESDEYPGCWYRTVNGETEWLNPPMITGEEYRTTKRYMGKPVYAGIKNIDALPSDTTTKTTIADVTQAAADSLVYSQLVVYNAEGNSWINEEASVEWYTGELNEKAYIKLQPHVDMSKYYGRLHIEYTRQ